MPTIVNQDSAGNTYWGYIDSVLGNQGITLDSASGSGYNLLSNYAAFFSTAYGTAGTYWAGSGDNADSGKRHFGFKFNAPWETKTGAILGDFDAAIGSQQMRCALSFDGGQFGFSSSNELSAIGITWGSGVPIAPGDAGLAGLNLLADGTIVIASVTTSKVYKSTDNGATWDSGVLVDSGAGLIDIVELSNGNILVCAYTSNKVYKSTDNGATWDSGVLVDSGAGLYGIIQLSNGNVLASGYLTNKVYKSTDNGATWDSGILVASGAGIMSGHQVSNGDVFVAGTLNSKIYKSTDNGATWDSGVTVPSANRIYDITSKSDTIYICCDASKTIHTSTDNGATWSVLITKAYGMRGICFNQIGELCVSTSGATRSIYKSDIRYWIAPISFAYASSPTPRFLYMIANDKSLIFVNVGGGSNGRNTQGFVLYMGWLKDPGYTGNQYPRNFAYMLNSTSARRATLVNATGTTNFSTAANSITNPTITCEVATPGADATDVIFRDSSSPYNAIGKPYNMIALPSSFPTGNIYTNNGVDPDSSDNNKWLCVGNWGGQKLGVRVWLEGYI